MALDAWHSATASTSACDPGVQYFTMGTFPSSRTPSGVRLLLMASPFTASAVQYSGWQWTTAPVSGSRLYSARWNLCSMDGLPSERTSPSIPMSTMSSGSSRPLFLPEGVMSTSSSLILTLMFPPADTVSWRS